MMIIDRQIITIEGGGKKRSKRNSNKPFSFPRSQKYHTVQIVPIVVVVSFLKKFN